MPHLRDLCLVDYARPFRSWEGMVARREALSARRLTLLCGLGAFVAKTLAVSAVSK
jgi:hypothetical protein